jgi:hypothetical protein
MRHLPFKADISELSRVASSGAVSDTVKRGLGVFATDTATATATTYYSYYVHISRKLNVTDMTFVRTFSSLRIKGIGCIGKEGSCNLLCYDVLCLCRSGHGKSST